MLDRLTHFPSAYGPERLSEGRPPGGVSSERSRSAKREDVPVETPQAGGPGQVRYSFSTARMIAL